jgi:small subunit ribosomal protein S17e
MGQVKNIFIKSLAKRLIEKYPERFTKNFEKNKGELDGLVSLESKKIRNMVAGYIVHLVEKMEKPTQERPVQFKERDRRRVRRRKRRK